MQFAINLNEDTSIFICAENEHSWILTKIFFKEMDINKKLGLQLQELRTISRLTQEQAAEKAGVSVRTLHSLESGNLKSYVNSMQKVCEAYGATLNIVKK